MKPENLVIDSGVWPTLHSDWYKDSVIAYRKTKNKVFFLMRNKTSFLFVESIAPNKRIQFGLHVELKSDITNHKIEMLEKGGVILKPRLFKKAINLRFLENI